MIVDSGVKYMLDVLCLQLRLLRLKVVGQKPLDGISEETITYRQFTKLPQEKLFLLG